MNGRWKGPRGPATKTAPSGEDASLLLEGGLRGDDAALERLVERLTPVIARRVIRSLVRSGRSAQDCRDRIRDLVQDVFLDLFDREARILRTWEPTAGLSLENFVGLVAERRTTSRLERCREPAPLETAGAEGPAVRAAAADPEREALARADWSDLLDRVEERISPQGWELFQLLFVEECSLAEIEARTRLRRDAIYAWRSRLKKLVVSIYRERSAAGRPVADRPGPPRIAKARGGL